MIPCLVFIGTLFLYSTEFFHQAFTEHRSRGGCYIELHAVGQGEKRGERYIESHAAGRGEKMVVVVAGFGRSVDMGKEPPRK